MTGIKLKLPGVVIKLLACIWLWEASALFVALCLYRMEAEPDLRVFISHLSFKLLLAAAIWFACMNILVFRYSLAASKEGNSPFSSILRWNLVPVVLMITIAETGLRVLSTDTLMGTLLADKPLGPRRLETVSYSHRPLEIMEYDSVLGWTVKSNIRSSDGLYDTGDRGMRVSKSRISISAKSAACRIALLGDSHTFGEELKFEETWGHVLKEYLPQRCEIFNYGVIGHSVGQMYLRFLRDVRPSHPDIVIFALSSGTTERTMGVYGLNMFSSDLPWAQPRFELINHELVPINFPLPSLESITHSRLISELPYIDYDRYFVPGKWEVSRWRYMYNSYLFRLYVTWYPPYRSEYFGNSREAINHELLRSFLRTVKNDGATPMVVYLPDKDEYRGGWHENPPSISILATSGIQYLDLRPCLDAIEVDDRFITNGSHYSLKGSTAIAKCVAMQFPSLKHLPSTARHVTRST